MATLTRKRRIFLICGVCVLLFFLLQILGSLNSDDVIFGGPLNGVEYDEFWIEENVDYGGQLIRGKTIDKHDKFDINAAKLDIKVPIILWWTGFTGERGKVKTCGEDKCFFTVDRHFQSHPKTQVFVFYGTDFHVHDLPLPRQPHHQWALMHEESPKNNYKLSQPECLSLFNHTATFKRQSDYPITTQYLENLSDLTSTEFLVPTREKSQNGLAPVAYVQSDCDPPSDRDSYVEELMKYVAVDSYGACLHNKDLPDKLKDPLTMDDSQFHKILAKYKFILSFENAACDDYITEKLWRVFKIGSVPIYRGSPSVKDWLPSQTSALLTSDFSSPKELAEQIKYLNENDEEYDKYLQYKRNGVTNKKLLEVMHSRKWGVNDYRKMNFIDGFECFICNRIHRNNNAVSEGREIEQFIASSRHYDCPRPSYFDSDNPNHNIDLYMQLFDQSRFEAKALHHFVATKKNFTKQEYREYALQLKKYQS